MRFSSPKFLLRRLAFRKDAGEFITPDYLLFLSDVHLPSIVEFSNQEDAQRAIRELSEQTLLGRPVFIREVGSNGFTV